MFWDNSITPSLPLEHVGNNKIRQRRHSVIYDIVSSKCKVQWELRGSPWQCRGRAEG